MTTKEWAQRLNGREYRNELTKEEAKQAEEDGVIIALGYSDDLLELFGVINQEVSAFDGVDFGLVKAIWCPRNEMGEIYTSWLIESPFPHEKFNIYEDDELYCVGAVIKVAASSMSNDFHHRLLNEGFYSEDGYIRKNKKLMKEETINLLLEDLSEEEVIKILKVLTEE